MLTINPKGKLCTPSASGRDIEVTGVIFMDNIYAAKCWHLAITGQKSDNDRLLDDTLKFSIS
jgi:hypothetical protein